MRSRSQFLGIITCIILFGSALSQMQSYEMKIEKINYDMVADRKILDGSNVYVMGRNRVVNGTLEIFEDVDDEHFQMSVALYSDPNGNGQFHPMPYSVPQMPLCTALSQYGSYAQPSLQPGVNTDFPIDGDVCPIPKGVYYFRDVEIHTDNMPNQAPRGFLKAVMSFFKDNEYVGEIEILCRIEDKLTSIPNNWNI